VAPAGRHYARLSDAELVTLATMQAVLGYASEAKWLRHLAAECELLRERPRQTLIGDKNYSLTSNGTEGAHPEVS
jgi:hypothetical protein